MIQNNKEGIKHLLTDVWKIDPESAFNNIFEIQAKNDILFFISQSQEQLEALEWKEYKDVKKMETYETRKVTMFSSFI